MRRRSILYLHNAKAPYAENSVVAAFRAAGLAVEVLDPRREALPRHLRWAGIHLSGSGHGVHERLPWMAEAADFVTDCIAAEVPVLGVCFGSQLLAFALCGPAAVFRRPFCEVGYLPLRPTAAAHRDPLMQGWTDERPMLVWHNDEVTHAHPDIRVLAGSTLCPNQIWRYRDRPVWGVQGHPDVTAAEAPEWLAAHAEALRADGADLAALAAAAAAPHAGPELVERFAAFCVAQSRGVRDGAGHA